MFVGSSRATTRPGKHNPFNRPHRHCSSSSFFSFVRSWRCCRSGVFSQEHLFLSWDCKQQWQFALFSRRRQECRTLNGCAQQGTFFHAFECRVQRRGCVGRWGTLRSRLHVLFLQSSGFLPQGTQSKTAFCLWAIIAAFLRQKKLCRLRFVCVCVWPQAVCSVLVNELDACYSSPVQVSLRSCSSRISQNADLTPISSRNCCFLLNLALNSTSNQEIDGRLLWKIFFIVSYTFSRHSINSFSSCPAIQPGSQSDSTCMFRQRKCSNDLK